jgi:hypothetical protein
MSTARGFEMILMRIALTTWASAPF